jgi:hypothetical protein
LQESLGSAMRRKSGPNYLQNSFVLFWHVSFLAILSVSLAAPFYPCNLALAHPLAKASSKPDELGWVFVVRFKSMGIVIVRLSSLGIKWESQIADAIGNLTNKEIVVYNDASHRYCNMTVSDLESDIRYTAEFEKRRQTNSGWIFYDWKKVGTEKLFGLKSSIYERRRVKHGNKIIVDKLWLVEDTRFDKYRESAGRIIEFASRSKLPELGLPLRRISTVSFAHQPKFRTEPQPGPGEDALAELVGIPKAAEKDRSPAVEKSHSPRLPKEIKAQSAPFLKEPGNTYVEFDIVSVSREKVDPARFQMPKNYTKNYKQVKNYMEVLGLGSVDGSLSY